MAKESFIIKKIENVLRLSRLTLIVGVLFFLSASLNLAQNSIKYNFDYSVFSYDSTSNYIEIYYSVDKSSLKSITANKKQYTEISLNISIQNFDNDLLINNDYVLKDSLSKSGKNIEESMGVLRYAIPFGKLKLNVTVTDQNDLKSSESREFDISSSKLFLLKNSISNIQLARLISPDTTEAKNIFDKNNYKVFPNPSLVFDDQYSQLYFYSELYNLDLGENGLLLYQKLFAPNKEVLYQRKNALSVNQKSKVKVGMINLKGLKSGAYNFALQIIDSSDNVISTSEKRFYFHTQLESNKNETVISANGFLSSEFAVFSEEECDDMINKIRYVATSNELNQYQLLSKLNDKRNFLYQFWEKRDSDKSTKINEYKVEVMKRVDEADKRFGALKKSGATTDRGRVLILYGMPDEIDRYPNESGIKPYEIWKYRDVEGGVIFVFGDLLGLEDFRLLHSTKRGELRQPNWLESLRGN